MTGPPHEPGLVEVVDQAASVRLTRGLAAAAAGLGLLTYLLGFVGEVSVTGSFGGVLLLLGGLLAGLALVPQAGRVLPAAAVLTVAGGLLLLQFVLGIRGAWVLLLAIVVAALQTGAVVVALLLDVGVLGASRRVRALPPERSVGFGAVGPGMPAPPAAAIDPPASSGDAAGPARDPDPPAEGTGQ